MSAIVETVIAETGIPTGKTLLKAFTVLFETVGTLAFTLDILLSRGKGLAVASRNAASSLHNGLGVLFRVVTFQAAARGATGFGARETLAVEFEASERGKRMRVRVSRSVGPMCCRRRCHRIGISRNLPRLATRAVTDGLLSRRLHASISSVSYARLVLASVEC